MPWNDSDDNKPPHDPWSKRPKQEGPPDLDEFIRKLQQKLRRLFGVKGGGIKGQAGGEPGRKRNPFGFIFIAVLVVVIWVLSGIFIVSPAEQSVILRFGKYSETVGPGPHWIPRFIDSNYKINVQRISNFPYQAEMLTKDENIVSVAVAVQYRVNNPKDFLFNIVKPISSLQQITASALRQVIGQTTLDAVLTTERQQVRDQIQQKVDQLLVRYNSGLVAVDVTLQPAKPPEAVTAAFDDAIKAREDKQRYINQADAYAEKVVPIAKGNAARLLQAASADKQQRILRSQADTARFLALMPAFQQAPVVTRERLYLDTVESVLNHTSKIFVDVKGSNNMLYLPLDKIFTEKRIKPANLEQVALGDDGSTLSTGTDTSDSTRISRSDYTGRLTRGLY